MDQGLVPKIPNSISLFCIVHGDSDAEPLDVTIERQESVSALKKVIVKDRPRYFKDIGAADLKVWRWNKQTDEVKDSALNNSNVLDPRKAIIDTFKDKFKRGCTHVTIKALGEHVKPSK